MRISLDDTLNLVRAEEIPQLAGAEGAHSRRIHAGGLPGQELAQAVAEGALAGLDEEGAADGLEEEGDGGDDGEVAFVDGGLVGHDGGLEGEAGADAEEDLVADPVGGAGADVYAVEEAGRDGDYGGAGDYEGDVVAQDADEAAGEDGEEGGAEDEGEDAQAGCRGGNAVNGLEVDGEVVEQDEERTREEEFEQAASGDAAVREDFGGDQRMVFRVEFHGAEGGPEEDKADEGADDLGGAPRVNHATPLGAQEESDDGAEQ